MLNIHDKSTLFTSLNSLRYYSIIIIIVSYQAKKVNDSSFSFFDCLILDQNINIKQ